MQPFDHAEAAGRFVLRLAMVLVVAAGVLMLIIPVCHAGMSATPIAGSSTAPTTATVVTAHIPTSGAGCVAVRAGVEPCRVGTRVSAPSGAQSSAGVWSAVGSTAAGSSAVGSSAVGSSAVGSSAVGSSAVGSSAVGSSRPWSGASMLACITVLMVVLVALRWLRRPRSHHKPAVALRCAPMLITRCARPPTLAELCVLRT